MKVFFALAIAQVCLTTVFTAEENCTIQPNEDLNSVCGYPHFLTLVSEPSKKVVDGENCDTQYNKKEWQKEPTVMFKDAKENATYTLLCVDPDPPNYKKGEFWLHWLVSNIQGVDFAKGDLSKAKHLTSYYGPAPPSGSGVHRYMFVAFENESENLQLDNPARRGKFVLSSWLQQQAHLCGPVAGVQFRTQF